MKTQRPIYVVMEGVEAAGKTSIVGAMRRTRGNSLIAFKAPSLDGPIGGFIRECFEGKHTVSEKSMLHLFAADTIDQEVFIAEQLETGHDVVIDRHNLVSAMVYQTEVHDPSTVRLVNPKNLYLRPDLLVLLDVFPAEAAKRLEAREAQQTDGKYKTFDLDVIGQRRKDYHSAFSELKDENWPRETLRIKVGGVEPMEIASKVLEVMESLRDSV